MIKEMYAANVKNWLMELATGAKAAQREIQFAAESDKDRKWRVTASCYDTMEEVNIHNLKALADAIDIPVKFIEFKETDYHYGKYPGYYYFDMFGVRFCDLADKGEENDEGK